MNNATASWKYMQVGGEVLPHVEEIQYLRVFFIGEETEREVDRWISAASEVTWTL